MNNDVEWNEIKTFDDWGNVDATCCHMKSFKRRTIVIESQWKEGRCEVSTVSVSLFIHGFTPDVVVRLSDWNKIITVCLKRWINYLCRCRNVCQHYVSCVSARSTLSFPLHHLLSAPLSPVYSPVNVSMVVSVQSTTTVPSGMFILLHQNPCYLWLHQRVTYWVHWSHWASVDLFPVRIGIWSPSDTFPLLTNVHSFTAGDAQRYRDGCQKNKQIWVPSFTFTSCFLSLFSSQHLTCTKWSICLTNYTKFCSNYPAFVDYHHSCQATSW